jgi:deazaflavin-dependent oxidoreductase (nitroreductase family)
VRPRAGGAEVGDDSLLYVIAEHGENAAWVRNLRANPVVSVRVGARSFVGRARVVDAAAEPELWRDVRARSEAKYGWGDGLVVEIARQA